MSTFQRSFFFVFLISIVAVAASIALEVFAKIEPCYLCKVQRIGCFFTAFFAVIGIISSQMKKTIAIFLVVLSFSNFLISSYHFGVQLGVFADVCAVISPATLTDFKGMLFQKQQAHHSCSSMTWIFGMPIVVWSALSSFTCFAVIAMTLGGEGCMKRAL